MPISALPFKTIVHRFQAQAAILGLALLGTLSCSRDPSTVEVPEGTPVILISVDTLRSDRLPAYGYQGVTTPNIDALRRDSVLFEKAYSHVPLTLPAHTSILTGLLPSEHRVRDNMGYRVEAADIPFLPRILGQAGYATGAAISAYVLRAGTGISEYFDFFDDDIELRSDISLGSLQRPGHQTLEAAKPWLESVRQKPFFFLFHIYEPHTPHLPPEPFASRFNDPYDAEVALADAIVGRFLELLRKTGTYDRSLIIFLSDHGEGLWDHGAQEHMVLLNREVIQIPLMLKLPDSQRRGETISQPAQLIDVAPTILDLLGKEIPPELGGTPLLQLDEQSMPRHIFSESHYARLHFGWSQMASVTDGRYHYIHGPDPELFDMENDPGETQNILRDQRRVYGEMKAAAEAHDLEIQPPSEIDPEAREKLAALGYMGSVGGESEGPLADPKTKLHVIEDLKDARSLASGGDYEAAVKILERIVEEEPLLTDAWQQLGRNLGDLNRWKEAEEAIRVAMELSHGAGQVAMVAAEIYKSMGKLEDAKAHAELATESYEAAWDTLAQIALQEMDLEAAEGYVQKAVEMRGTRIGPLLTQGALLVAQERYDEALAVLTAAEQEFEGQSDPKQLAGIDFTRGKAYVFMGDTENGEKAFLAELERSPRSLGPYTHLAFLYALEDRGAEAGVILRRMVEANPTAEAHAAAVISLREMGDPRSADALLRMALRQWPDSPRLKRLAGETPG